MNIYTRSMIAGFVATIALSALMMLKAMMGVMPGLDVVSMLGGMSERFMGAGGAGIGWLMHFMIGTVVWGILFAAFYNALPGDSPVVKGVVFGVGAWVLMMVIAMPMAGAGFFGMSMGMMAPVMTLVLHVIWGAVLGWVFGLLGGEPTEA